MDSGLNTSQAHVHLQLLPNRPGLNQTSLMFDTAAMPSSRICLLTGCPPPTPTLSLSSSRKKRKNLRNPGVALLSTLALCLIWFWFPVYGAYAWFEGPVRTTEDSSSENSGSITDPKDYPSKEQTINLQSKRPSLSGLESVKV